MIHTHIAGPSGILKEYIQSFELKAFDTLNEVIKKPCHAFHEVLISLIIDSKKPLFEPVCEQISSYFCDPSKAPFSGVMGIQSNMKGFFVFQGRFKIFIIHFKPTGFSSIFQLPASLIFDQFLDAGEFFKNELEVLHAQFHEKVNFSDMVNLSERFLEKKLATNRHLWKNESIKKASNFLISEPNAFTIQQLAYHSNMTLKTFERNFIGLVGIPPKLFTRIRRFNQALELKHYHEKLSWLDVCLKTGYFDLMHLNKDFKAFSGNSPASFFKRHFIYMKNSASKPNTTL